MKIAVVAPNFGSVGPGPTDRLVARLSRAIGDEAGHEVERVELTIGRRDLADIVRAHEGFAGLDLGRFDLALSVGSPAWLLHHPHHVCYLLQRRHAMAEVDRPGPPAPADHDDPEVAALQRFMQSASGDRGALPEFFGRFHRIAELGSPLLAPDGPVAREVLRWLDGIALAPGGIARLVASSGIVAAELGLTQPIDILSLPEEADTGTSPRSGPVARRAVADVLLAPVPRISETRRSRRKISVAVTFPVWPPRGGGQSRIFHLYRQLAKHHDVDIVCVANANDLPSEREIAPGLREIRIPKSPAHRAAELALSRAIPGVPLTDVAMPRLAPLTPDYRAALSTSAASADLVVASHPYLFPLLRDVTDRPLWYEAHNVETLLKRGMLPDTPAARELLAETERVERDCCAASDRVIVCAEADGLVFQRDFGVPAGRIVELPNGVDLGTVTYVGLAARAARQDRLELHDATTMLFMGSGHKPNVDALDVVLRCAEACSDISFLILGSVCGHAAGRPLPPNVGLMGEVDDVTKDTVLGTVDGALNPMAAGSGTNLKMLDYFASGVPVISTLHGARGLAVEDGVHLRLSTLDDFPAALRRLQAESGGGELGARVVAARRLVEDHYAWPVIAARFLAAIDAAGVGT
jgi:glycosyltransferase involved in cell wall biosynthesis